MDWPGVKQGFDAGQDGRERDAGGGDVEASGTVTQQPAPGLNPFGETANHGQLGCAPAPGCCAAARGWNNSNSIGDR